MKQLFAPGEDTVYEPSNVKSYLAPGAWGLLAPLFDETPADQVTRAQVAELLGSAGAIVLADGSANSQVEVLRDEVATDARHSCGACTPCREGLPAIAKSLTKIVEGKGSKSDREFVRAVAETVEATSLCAFGKHAAFPILGALETFEEEFVAHLDEGEV
jgi:NADH:ubiquinone oxidoreductase subunit F (NADH-binding)